MLVTYSMQVERWENGQYCKPVLVNIRFKWFVAQLKNGIAKQNQINTFFTHTIQFYGVRNDTLKELGKVHTTA